MEAIKEKKVTIEPGQRLLNINQAAHFLNISARTLYNATAPKSKNPFPIKPKRIGKSLRFDLRELEQFIESL